MKHQCRAAFIRHPNLNATRDRRVPSPQKGDDVGVPRHRRVGNAETPVDANLNCLVRPEEFLGVEQVLHDERHVRPPSSTWQAVAARKLGVSGIELERVGGPIITLRKPEIVGNARIVMPKLNGAHVRAVVAATKYDHPHEEFTGEHGQSYRAGEPRGLIGGGLGLRATSISQDDRSARAPGLGCQSLSETEARKVAHGAERIEPAAKFEPRPILRKHPDLCGSNEGLHRRTPINRSTSCLGSVAKQTRAADAPRGSGWHGDPYLSVSPKGCWIDPKACAFSV